MEPLKNRYFRRAVNRASDYLRNNRRLAGLLASVSMKLNETDMSKIKNVRLFERIGVFARMVKAYARGTYREIPWKSVVLMAGALIYFVTPLDLIPDFIPISGLLDDLTVIVWVYQTLREEIDEFMEWELGRQVEA